MNHSQTHSFSRVSPVKSTKVAPKMAISNVVSNKTRPVKTNAFERHLTLFSVQSLSNNDPKPYNRNLAFHRFQAYWRITLSDTYGGVIHRCRNFWLASKMVF